MKYKTVLSKESIEAINSGGVIGNVFYFSGGELDRKVYLNIKKSFEDNGGKWTKKENGFVFKTDPTDILRELVSSGFSINKDKLDNFFKTPDSVIDDMIEFADFNNNSGDILEPSAGEGHIVKRLNEKNGSGVFNKILAIEKSKERVDVIRQFHYDVIEADFLKTKREDIETNGIGVVIMNPPFNVEGDKNAYIKHIKHALSFLNSGGILVSVVPVSFLNCSDAESMDFRAMVEYFGEFKFLRDDAFKESGTMVRTGLVKFTIK